jgi:hypothetical protein
MKKRSVLLCMAAALVASLAFVTPSRAESTLVTTNAGFIVFNGTATDIEATYTLSAGASITSGVTINASGGLSISSATVVGTDEVSIVFAASSGTTPGFNSTNPPTLPLRFTFSTDSTSTSLNTISLTGVSGPILPIFPVIPVVGGSISILPQAVPEPASLALLGIGMTGFLAFRRFLKRSKLV